MVIAIRGYRSGDAPALWAVYYSAIREAAARDYSPQQIAAWAPDDFDPSLWAERMAGISPFVAERDGTIVGYADVQPNGYIDHFFVAGHAGRQGVGQALMRQIHAHADSHGLRSLFADVSITARPFFERSGFAVEHERSLVVSGISLANFRMRKELALSLEDNVGVAAEPLNVPARSTQSKSPRLDTARLWLVPLTLADASQIQVHFAQWEVVRYLRNGVPWPYPPDGAFAWCRDVALPQMAAGEAWHWTMRLKTEPDQVVGLISLMTGDEDNRGFWVAPPWQRKGLASEAADAVTGYWFDVLRFPVLRAPKAVANVASRRISERQGMRVVMTEEREYVSGRLPAETWELTADEWRARTRQAAAAPRAE